jgi:hypothetical protein
MGAKRVEKAITQTDTGSRERENWHPGFTPRVLTSVRTIAVNQLLHIVHIATASLACEYLALKWFECPASTIHTVQRSNRRRGLVASALCCRSLTRSSNIPSTVYETKVRNAQSIRPPEIRLAFHLFPHRTVPSQQSMAFACIDSIPTFSRSQAHTVQSQEITHIPASIDSSSRKYGLNPFSVTLTKK